MFKKKNELDTNGLNEVIYLSKNIALKDIIGEYNLKDTKRINIYLKKIYRTNIKELKKENNLRNINTSEGDKKLKIKSKE